MVPPLSMFFIMEPLSLPNQRNPCKVEKIVLVPHSNKLLQKCVIFNKAINLHSRGPTEPPLFHIIFQSIVSVNLIKSIVSIFLLVSINQRLVPHLISLGQVYMHVQNDIHMGWWLRPLPS